LIVLDCSALVAIVFAIDPWPEHISAFAAAEAIAAPDYLVVEFLSATRRLASLGQLDDTSALAGIHFVQHMAFHGFDTTGISAEIWSLRRNFSAYDAGYVALAQILDAPLLSCDRRLRSAATAHTKVNLI
jgi:predicted nucleic acid-binding protein